jgi:hypothetical protein
MSSWGVAIRFEADQIAAAACCPQNRGSHRSEGSPANWQYVTDLSEDQARALAQALASGQAAQVAAARPTGCGTGRGSCR